MYQIAGVWGGGFGRAQLLSSGYVLGPTQAGPSPSALLENAQSHTLVRAKLRYETNHTVLTRG